MISVSTSTTTTLPCTSARCTLDAARTGPACAGQAVPPGLAAKLTKAETLLDEAATTPGKKARGLRHAAKRTLTQVGKIAIRAARRKEHKISAACAAALKAATDRVVAGLGQ